MAGRCPKVEVLGDFSIDENGNYRKDSSQRRFLVKPITDDHLHSDLCAGIDDYIAQEQPGVRPAALSSVQDWIHDNMQGLTERKILEETERGGTRKLNVDFIGSAGVFSLLLRAGQSIVGLEILVTRCNGTYYIESSPRTTPPMIQVGVHVPPHRVPEPAPLQEPYNPPLKCSSGRRHGARSRAPRSARESNRAQNLGQSNSRRPSPGSRATTPERNENMEILYAGRKFAMNVTSCTEGGVPSADEPVNANAKYVVVMKTHLGDHSLILSTKVQAERKDSSQTSPENYVFIRTRKGLLESHTLVAFRKYKMLEWWSQAYIAGIPEVLCGMRDDRNHEITSVKTFEVKKLSEMSRGSWDQRKCRDTFIAYLSEIKRRIQVDNPRVVHRLELPDVKGGRGVEERLRRRELIFHPTTDDDDSVILTDQYRRGVLNIQENH